MTPSGRGPNPGQVLTVRDDLDQWGPGGRFACRLSALNPHRLGVPRGSLSVISWLTVSSSAIKLAEAAPGHTLSKSSDGSG